MSIRAAVFTLLGFALLCGTPVPGGSAPGDATDGVAADGMIRYDLITHLEVDWLEDDVEAPQAFGVNSGVWRPPGEARFRVFAATEYPRYYYDVTADFQPRRVPKRQRGVLLPSTPHNPLQIITRGLGKVRASSSEFHYDAEQNAIVYRPTLNTRFDGGAIGIVDFRWRLRSYRVTYKTMFVLAVQPR